MESDDISEELLGYLTDTNFDEVANKGLNDDGQSSDEDNEGANNEDDDSADKIPEHRFDVRITTGKFGAMKGEQHRNCTRKSQMIRQEASLKFTKK